jgi:hypothetical protein
MADGDNVHEDLDPRWQDPYKQVCEWGLGEEAIAETVAERLKLDVKMYGEAPHNLLFDYADILAPLIDGPMLHNVANYVEVNTRAEELARISPGQPLPLDAAQRAFEQQLQDIRWGIFTGDAQELREAIMAKYIYNIYVSNFEEKGPFNPQEHHKNVDQQTVSDRLAAIRSYIDKEINSLARQLAQPNSRVARLRSSPHRRSQQFNENYRPPIPAAGLVG